jgi:electron transfer flavoprotein beta subunit
VTIAVCWKWVAPEGDARWAGVSDADQAALEVALRMAATGGDIIVVSVGPPGAEAGLREALAVGASQVVRVDAPAALCSDRVAAAIAAVVGTADWVVCGDASSDRGSGSVPAYLAAELGAAQALGLVSLEQESAGVVRALRRLDGGRREELRIHPPAVLSVEGAVARLRRASLPAEVAARAAVIEMVAGPDGPCEEPRSVGPYRPRARVLPAPDGSTALARVRSLTDVAAVAEHGETLTAEPAEAAAHILATLRAWGRLPQ